MLRINPNHNHNLVLRCQNLERLLQKVTAERDSLKVSIEQTEMKANELERQCKDLQDERDTLDRELQNVRGLNDQLKIENSNLGTHVQE